MLAPMLTHVVQKTFQKLLPSIMNVIGQCIESNNESGARQLFDVLETLLVLVGDSTSATLLPN